MYQGGSLLLLLVRLFEVAQEYVSKWGQPRFMMISHKSIISHNILIFRCIDEAISCWLLRVDLQSKWNSSDHLREISLSLPTKNSGLRWFNTCWTNKHWGSVGTINPVNKGLIPWHTDLLSTIWMKYLDSSTNVSPFWDTYPVSQNRSSDVAVRSL